MACLNGCGKILPPSGLDFWNVEPVASRYTDYATYFGPQRVRKNQMKSKDVLYSGWESK
jgi:hypothetical protein